MPGVPCDRRPGWRHRAGLVLGRRTQLAALFERVDCESKHGRPTQLPGRNRHHAGGRENPWHPSQRRRLLDSNARDGWESALISEERSERGPIRKRVAHATLLFTFSGGIGQPGGISEFSERQAIMRILVSLLALASCLSAGDVLPITGLAHVGFMVSDLER